ncbi:5'-nucleotidase [Aureobasidium pullulans]|nr:5'-nucleotidase [Aureobasidium pullulans]
MPSENAPILRLLHFNDVYRLEPSEHDPIGGITRFQSLCNHYRQDPKYQDQPQLITLFSGDGFGPSLESSVTKGAHMVPILNNVPVTAACVGNHELDMGVPQFEYLASQCAFLWLLANVTDPALGDDVPLGHAHKTTMLTSSNGIKIGLIGLAEKEWLEAVNALLSNLIHTDPVVSAKKLIPGLRAQGAEIIIALCHQREHHDVRLAQETPEGLIDLVLSGHDHHYRQARVRSTQILCSGSDYKQLSYIEASRTDTKWDFNITRRDVNSAVPEDPHTVALMDKLFSSLQGKLQKVIGYTAVPLDARFATVRASESNMGNFVSDLMRFYYNTDCAMLVGGTIRADTVYPPGILRLKDIVDCFPFEDPVVVIRVKGQQLLEALQNGVSKYPALDGRFPQVSNISFTFDPSRDSHDRIVAVQVNGKPLDLEREYTLATREYMVKGGDGYTCLRTQLQGGSTTSIVDEENGILVSMLLRQHFLSSMTVGRWKHWGAALGHHWGTVQEQLRRTGSVVERTDTSHTFRRDSNDVSARRTSVDVSSGRRKSSAVWDRPPIRIVEPAEIGLSESEDESEVTAPVLARELSPEEHELVVARKAMRKWWRLAGLSKRHAMGYETGEELGVGWTRGICPQMEGRIKMVLRVL